MKVEIQTKLLEALCNGCQQAANWVDSPIHKMDWNDAVRSAREIIDSRSITTPPAEGETPLRAHAHYEFKATSEAVEALDSLDWHEGKLRKYNIVDQAIRAELERANQGLARRVEELEGAIKVAYPELVNGPRPAYARRELEKIYDPATGEFKTAAALPEFQSVISRETKRAEDNGKLAHDLGIQNAALARQLAERGWQSIESAPINQSVLVWLPNCEHYGDPVYRAILVDMGTGRRWTITGLSMGRDLAKDDAPTHWMPLPPAPERGDG